MAYGNARWTVKTANGLVSARALVLATNAYTGEFEKRLAPQIAREVIPVLSCQMATKPISDNVAKTVIPGRQAMSDTHRELYFARWDARNRLVTGAASMFPGPMSFTCAFAAPSSWSAMANCRWPRSQPPPVSPIRAICPAG
jgi:glycine/D-amino acid oxidase-like deaminating enzyme